MQPSCRTPAIPLHQPSTATLLSTDSDSARKRLGLRKHATHSGYHRFVENRPTIYTNLVNSATDCLHFDITDSLQEFLLHFSPQPRFMEQDFHLRQSFVTLTTKESTHRRDLDRPNAFEQPYPRSNQHKISFDFDANFIIVNAFTSSICKTLYILNKFTLFKDLILVIPFISQPIVYYNNVNQHRTRSRQ